MNSDVSSLQPVTTLNLRAVTPNDDVEMQAQLLFEGLKENNWGLIRHCLTKFPKQGRLEKSRDHFNFNALEFAILLRKAKNVSFRLPEQIVKEMKDGLSEEELECAEKTVSAWLPYFSMENTVNKFPKPTELANLSSELVGALLDLSLFDAVIEVLELEPELIIHRYKQNVFCKIKKAPSSVYKRLLSIISIDQAFSIFGMNAAKEALFMAVNRPVEILELIWNMFEKNLEEEDYPKFMNDPLIMGKFIGDSDLHEHSMVDKLIVSVKHCKDVWPTVPLTHTNEDRVAGMFYPVGIYTTLASVIRRLWILDNISRNSTHETSSGLSLTDEIIWETSEWINIDLKSIQCFDIKRDRCIGYDLWVPDEPISSVRRDDNDHNIDDNDDNDDNNDDIIYDNDYNIDDDDEDMSDAMYAYVNGYTGVNPYEQYNEYGEYDYDFT
eukprot:TRINITY_DN2275_c0_g1_i1.p1 TRINITY_DN2275_c0_g1~~TRINITY_DN2275_c0_g1_i1.p1  ORF type:complete len:439 (-),score=92.75 TRINITY_DN2275_c0_g1_i1:104-1420(-)